MNIETVQYIQKFYQTAIKDHINNPIVNSQWTYFTSMLKSNPFDRDRVQLYLNILQNQRNKHKPQSQLIIKTTFNQQKQDLLPYPLFEKKYSEPMPTYQKKITKKNESGMQLYRSSNGIQIQKLTDASGALLKLFQQTQKNLN